MFYILRRPTLGRKTCLSFQQNLKQAFNIDTTILLSNKPLPTITNEDIILHWGCIKTILNLHTILNHPNNISLVNNKKKFRKYLQINYPNLIPKTWFDINNPLITFPCILRHKTHAQGKHLWFCKNYTELQQAFWKYTEIYDENYYISEYIPKVKEYRVCFIQNCVAWVAEKIPASSSDITWNVAQGGKFINVRWKDWPINVIDVALLAHKGSHLFLSGIDIIVDSDNNPYILEVNSAPSHSLPYRQKATSRCLTWAIQKDNYSNIPQNDNYKKYLKYIHPGLL